MSLGLVSRASRGWRRVIGIADQGVVWARRVCGVCGAVPWGLLVGVSRGWCRVIRIGEQGVVWVAPCHWDCCPGRGLGGAVSLGLVSRASCGWRRVIRMADQGVVRISEEGVVWGAPCHWDC